MPQIGHSEMYYANLAHRAQKAYDLTARDAYKVGHYVTLGEKKLLPWPEKLRYYRHALDHHCLTPPYANEEMKAFYQNLMDLVRSYCGADALRLISAEDDTYAHRIQMGENADMIYDEAERFFQKFIETDECPFWFSPGDYDTMKLIRNQWI